MGKSEEHVSPEGGWVAHVIYLLTGIITTVTSQYVRSSREWQRFTRKQQQHARVGSSALLDRCPRLIAIPLLPVSAAFLSGSGGPAHAARAVLSVRGYVCGHSGAGGLDVQRVPLEDVVARKHGMAFGFVCAALALQTG